MLCSSSYPHRDKTMKKTVKKIVYNIMKKFPFVRTLARKIVNVKRKAHVEICARGQKVDSHTVFFMAFKGLSFACSPKAVYNYMLSSDEYNDFNFIWAFNKENIESYRFLEKNKNTKLVILNSKGYFRALRQARYWIVNYRMDDHISPRESQVYVQCWHGTPLKKLGYDIELSDNSMNSKTEIRKKYEIDAKKFDYIVSPTPFTSKVFTSAWNLKEFSREDAVLEIGYPRNDFLLNYTSEDAIRIKEELNIPKDKKIILYAPTWRDNQHTSGVGYTYNINLDFDKLQEELSDRYVIIFRVHYLVASSFDFAKYKGFIYDCSSYSDINHLYVITDLLITDYSSVMFDYAILKKPMLFYMYDIDDYKDTIRGLYFDLDELPARIITREDEMVGAIDDAISNFVFDEKYKQFNQKYNINDDGQSARRLVERVITK